MGDQSVRQRVRPQPRAIDVAAQGPIEHEGTCEVTRTMYGVETKEVSTVRVPIFKTTPAMIGVSGGLTRALGGYEFARFDVSVTLPAYPERSEMERAYAIAAALVDEKLTEQNNDVERAMAGNQEQIPIG